MTPEQIKDTVNKMTVEFQKVASQLEVMTKRAELAERALAVKAVSKVASSQDLNVKTAALTGRLVVAGVLPEDREVEFRTRIVEDPTELYEVCNKLASLVSSGKTASPDPDMKDEPESDGLDPIERFAR
jgi:hypothetical protein